MRRRRFWTIVLVVVQVALAVVVILTATENRRRSAEGREAHDALCVYKEANARRVAGTAELLRDHPGATVLGFPRPLLERSLRADRRDLAALARLDCVPPPPPKQEG